MKIFSKLLLLGLAPVFITSHAYSQQMLDLPFTIDQPAMLSSQVTVANVDCYGNSTGIATAEGIGGTSPYSYLWDGTIADSSISGLGIGDYYVLITDAKHCIMQDTARILYPDTFRLTVINEEMCQGDSISFGGSYISTPGIFFDTLTALNSCDSIVQLNLLFGSQDTIKTTRSICQGDSTFFFGSYFYYSGNY
ncbi:MAG: SprB repeat-containing protein, partial [Bacteroidetes bacterium]|nr:SprB repeat-containing protein [Bacteroidota bacterium]